MTSCIMQYNVTFFCLLTYLYIQRWKEASKIDSLYDFMDFWN